MDYELQKKYSDKVNNRITLVNEVIIDVTNKTAKQVLDEAIRLIEGTESFTEYSYEKPKKELFYSWVFSNGMR